MFSADVHVKTGKSSFLEAITLVNSSTYLLRILKETYSWTECPLFLRPFINLPQALLHMFSYWLQFFGRSAYRTDNSAISFFQREMVESY